MSKRIWKEKGIRWRGDVEVNGEENAWDEGRIYIG